MADNSKRVVYDPLVEILNYYSTRTKETGPKKSRLAGPVEERLKHRIIDGEKKGLESDLQDAMKTYQPLDIVNHLLLDGMRVVGELFGKGEMQLPFVLQSAEVMKTAVAFLEPHMEKTTGSQKGTMVLATVKGDVHDIGKNLVDIILTNNGYRVVNLGIKVAIDAILKAVDQHKADAVGMSGLLVKSTLIMKENLEVMIERGVRIPVMLGGAALTRRYVEEDLRAIFDGPLFYCEDAFAGLRAMEDIARGDAAPAPVGDPLDTPAETVADVVKRIRIVRHQWNKVLEYVSDEDFREKAQFGKWSLSELVAQLIGWEEQLASFLGSADRGGPWPEDDTLNERFAGRGASMNRDALIELWNDTQTTLIGVLQTLPDSVLQQHPAGRNMKTIVAEYSYAGQHEHLKKARQWLHERQTRHARLAPAKPHRSAVSDHVDIPKVPFYGSRIADSLILDDVYPLINDIALFRGQWQFTRGKMTPDEYDAFVHSTVQPVFTKWKDRAQRERLLVPRVVYGYFPCLSEGDDVIVYHDDLKSERLRFSFPRQAGDHRLCIADFFAPCGSGKMDVLGCMLVTVGRQASDFSARLFEENNYADYLYFHGLSVETAEALAEYWHRHMRREMGIGDGDAKETRKLFQQAYRGSRYSFGYPACPNLEDQSKLFTLLQPERIDVTLTEEFHLVPEQSTSAIVVHHPEARYFNI